MKNLIKSLFLILLAIVIFLLLLIPGILWQIISFFNKKETSTYLNDVAFSIAQCIDQLGNVVFQELFNDILITNNGYKFGSSFHTISFVIGMNKSLNTLTRTGLVLYNILNKIQPNHCEIAVQQNS